VNRTEREVLSVTGGEISTSKPRKLLFPAARVGKLDLVRYYLAAVSPREHLGAHVQKWRFRLDDG
jgi:DNA primase